MVCRAFYRRLCPSLRASLSPLPAGTWFPYILFGQNMQRALGLKYATQSMLYFLCVFFFRWLINMLAHVRSPRGFSLAPRLRRTPALLRG